MLVTRVTRYNAIWQFLRLFRRRTYPAAYGFACDQTINAMLWRVTHRAPVVRVRNAQGRCHCSFASSSLAHIRAWMINARTVNANPGPEFIDFRTHAYRLIGICDLFYATDNRCAAFSFHVTFLVVHQDFPFPHRVTGSRRNMTLPLRAFLRTMTPCTLLSSYCVWRSLLILTFSPIFHFSLHLFEQRTFFSQRRLFSNISIILGNE